MTPLLRTTVSGGEQALEVSVTHIAAVVIAGDDKDLLTLQPVEIFAGFTELLPVPHAGEVTGDHHHVGVKVVDFHQCAIEQVGHEILRPSVKVGQMRDDARAIRFVHIIPPARQASLVRRNHGPGPGTVRRFQLIAL